MITEALMQTMIVSLIVLWSVFVTLQRFFPALIVKQQQRLVSLLAAKGWHSLASYLQPSAKGQGGCGSGCSSCASACTTPETATVEQVVRWSHKS